MTITNNVAASDVYFLCALRHIGVMQVSLLFMQLLLGGGGGGGGGGVVFVCFNIMLN